MADDPFLSRPARPDLEEAFPADLVETLGPALLAESRETTAALVAAHLLRLAAAAGGTRVKTSAIDRTIEHLERSVTEEARHWCADEARRVASWCVDEPEAEPELHGDLAAMAGADREARIAVVEWAIAQGLDVELEWYDETEDRWPRLRATPLGVEVEDDEALVMVDTGLAEIAIPVANLRWLMPVERRERPPAKSSKILAFPRIREEE